MIMVHNQVMTFSCDHNTQSDNDIQYGFREITLSQFDYYGYSLVMKAIIVYDT